MLEQEKVENNLQKKVNDYLNIVEELTSYTENLPNFEDKTDEKELIEYKKKFQEFQQKLYKIQYSFSAVKCDPKTKVKNKHNQLVEIKVFDIGAKEWMDRVQNRLLYPVLLRLSDLSSRKSDLKYFFSGVLVSAFLSLIVGLFTPRLIDVFPWFKGDGPTYMEEIKDLKQAVLTQTHRLDSISNVINKHR